MEVKNGGIGGSKGGSKDGSKGEFEGWSGMINPLKSEFNSPHLVILGL